MPCLIVFIIMGCTYIVFMDCRGKESNMILGKHCMGMHWWRVGRGGCLQSFPHMPPSQAATSLVRGSMHSRIISLQIACRHPLHHPWSSFLCIPIATFWMWSMRSSLFVSIPYAWGMLLLSVPRIVNFPHMLPGSARIVCCLFWAPSMHNMYYHIHVGHEHGVVVEAHWSSTTLLCLEV